MPDLMMISTTWHRIFLVCWDTVRLGRNATCWLASPTQGQVFSTRMKYNLAGCS